MNEEYRQILQISKKSINEWRKYKSQGESLETALNRIIGVKTRLQMEYNNKIADTYIAIPPSTSEMSGVAVTKKNKEIWKKHIKKGERMEGMINRMINEYNFLKIILGKDVHKKILAEELIEEYTKKRKVM